MFPDGSFPDGYCANHALLLQGPAGPFMRRFAEDLREAGVPATKVNFHAGEVLFFHGPDAVAFRGTFEEWPAFVRELMEERGVDAIFLFGDCRPLHRAAIEAAHERGARVWVFEEGYLRPDWITLERDGVNGYSKLPRDPEFYLSQELPEPARGIRIGPSFGLSAWYSTLSALTFTHLNQGFPHYVHHRNLNAWYQTGSWVRGYFRKKRFEAREAALMDRFTGELSGRYFFVPLQVHCDFQLKHSRYESVPQFIEEVIDAFVEHAGPTDAIVFKHHPMDRAYCDYSELFRELARQRGVEGRLFYVHDLNLPALLKHARATININSTVGLQSIYHRTPVKVMGTAVYDMPGLTYQGTLPELLRDPAPPPPDERLYRAFRRYLLRTSQQNGNFYRRAEGTRGTGVRWVARRVDVKGGDAAAGQGVERSGSELVLGSDEDGTVERESRGARPRARRRAPAKE